LTSSTIFLTPASADRKEKLRKALRVLLHNPMVLVGLVIIAAWVFIALCAPVIAPTSPIQQDVMQRLQAPGNAHPFGTDELGRDIFTRVLYGGRITIPAGILVIVIGCTLGMFVGAVAGFVGGAWDELIMRVSELFMAFPTIILALAITAALGPDLRNAVIALVIVWWPGYARLIRGLVMEVKTREFVEGARSIGASSPYILFRTVLPNCISSALVLATLDIGNAILSFAGLSFLGLGPDPTSPEWGRMVSTGIDYFDQWWMWLYPGLAIATLVLAFNFIGDGLRDILDPRMRR
jgi:ABC-type dipeptide/oligopeptide/nickel transport system permease subunit